MARAQQIYLPPPTTYVLTELEPFTSIENVLEYARTKFIEPMLPTIHVQETGLVVALPGGCRGCCVATGVILTVLLHYYFLLFDRR